MDFFSNFLLLVPKGAIASAELGLMIQATLFMLIVIVPVLFLLFFFAWRYRAGNKKAVYQPNWEHSKMEELIWWAIPLEIVLILGAITWTSTHELHPPKPIGVEPPLVVQVVALDWKWLFIYPEQGIATVNLLVLPVDKPVRFDITADAPMNSFWIPELGGQIYAMTGMVNRLNLIANEDGTFMGRSANYSGEGFDDMTFSVMAVPPEQFESWVHEVHTSVANLSYVEYEDLAAPGVPETPLYYSPVEAGLFDMVVAQFGHEHASEELPSQASGQNGNAFEGSSSLHSH
ncbi:MAG: ubiquinol oxidase subunit II [Candidatus Pacebacteria bacterium]|nr:ubiquinol oxidase subunit II [Candidatus Paceibacterota bacterium]